MKRIALSTILLLPAFAGANERLHGELSAGVGMGSDTSVATAQSDAALGLDLSGKIVALRRFVAGGALSLDGRSVYGGALAGVRLGSRAVALDLLVEGGRHDMTAVDAETASLPYLGGRSELVFQHDRVVVTLSTAFRQDVHMLTVTKSTTETVNDCPQIICWDFPPSPPQTYTVTTQDRFGGTSFLATLSFGVSF